VIGSACSRATIISMQSQRVRSSAIPLYVSAPSPRVSEVVKSAGLIGRCVEYRASAALAACGALIATVLVAAGPRIGSDGASPIRSWPWIALGVFVAGVWGAAAVLAARRIEAARATSAPAPPPSSPRDVTTDASNVDFAPLFIEFLDMRSRCGDAGAAPTFEEFTRSLELRRAAMLARDRSRAVSFHVAFVDGHAVVRARGVA